MTDTPKNHKTTCRLCLVRHGETDWNAERRLLGQQDRPLNAVGLEQANAAAQALSDQRFAAAYTSNLKRASQTAEVIARRMALPLHTATSLRERCFGVLEGLTHDEARAQHPDYYTHFETRDLHCNLGSGESLSHFAQRVVAGLARIATAHANEQVLVVTHGGVLDVIFRHATGRALEARRDFDIPNAGINWIEIGTNGWAVLAWGQRDHLAVTRDVYL